MSELKLNIGDACRASATGDLGFVVGLEGVSFVVDFGGEEGELMNACDLNLDGLYPFFVTYGMGGNLANCYSKVWAEDYSAARDQIDDVIKGRFAFCYDEGGFAGQPEKYGLSEVPLQAQVLNSADQQAAQCRF